MQNNNQRTYTDQNNRPRKNPEPVPREVFNIEEAEPENSNEIKRQRQRPKGKPVG